MGGKEYKQFLTKIKNKICPYLNTLGLYYDDKIQKFIGFNEYELILIEFEEFLTDAELAINFKRYTNMLDENYHFLLPKKEKLYGSRDLSFSHWKYCPEGVDKSDKEHLNKHLDMIANEMLEQIKLKLKPRVLTDYPIEEYIKEKYLQVVDDLARENHPLGYDFEDEWVVANEERINGILWRSDLCNEQYDYVSKRRESLLLYQDFYIKMMQRYETNIITYKKDVNDYLSKFTHRKLIKPAYKHYTIREAMNLEFGRYIEQSLMKHGFARQESRGCYRNNQEAFYNEELDFEIYLTVYDGIEWAFSYSVPDEYGMLTVKNIRADCDGICFINDANYEEQANQAIRKISSLGQL